MAIPKELMEKREAIECNFIFSLYKDPTLISEYGNVVNGTDIITQDGQFYYGLLCNLYKSGIQNMDNISIYTYLEDKKVLKNGFETRGGYKTIQEITGLLSTKNIDAYYDDLVKSNLLINLDKNGFDVVNKLDKFRDMSSEEVYSYFEYILSDIAVGKIEKLHSEDLSTDYDKYIEMWDQGNDVGYKISSGMLNYQLLGVHKKNLLLHLAGIGQGKTSSAIAWYILPTIETEDVVIIANEQDASQWRQMILSTVLFTKIGKVEGFSRHKMIVGNYTDEQKKKMQEAAMWLNSQPGKIIFIETQDYNADNIKKIVARYSALGAGLFIVDTLKPMDDSSERSWGLFSEVAKGLFLTAKKYNVAMVATCQLSPDALSRRYLDLTCIAKAKAIAETATQVVMLRPIPQEEKEKIKGYNYEGKMKKEVLLDKNKDYIMVFTPRNRYGQVSPQIIMERNMNFNTYKDVCWYECPYDTTTRR